MNSIYMRYVIIWLLGLTQNFFTASEGNVTSKQKTLAKVFTSFLKVPWINLNSSWTEVVTSACRNDIVALFESAENGEMWALKMLDAASKVPSGILTGNIFDLGMFDECVGVKSHTNPANITGQHYMISLYMPTKFYTDTSKMMRIQKLNMYNPSADVAFGLSMSVCVPSSCGVQDVSGLVNASVGNIPELSAFEVGVAQVVSTNSEPPKLTTGSILTISFFAMVAILLLFCTACEFVLTTRRNDVSIILKNAAKFSLHTNLLKLTNTKLSPDSMPAIHGLRVLSMCSIVIAHRTYMVMIEPKVNSSDLNEFLLSPLVRVGLTFGFTVDTFFLMSGFLMAHSFLKALSSEKKINLFAVYLLRYIRFIPSLAVVLLFVVFIIPHLESGPAWKSIIEAQIDNCQKNWWTNVLCIHNIVNVDEICLGHTWYLGPEMQMFWLSPIILYPLFYRPKLGLVLLGLLLIASFITPAVHFAVTGYSAWLAMEKSTAVMLTEFKRGYSATYDRALPYLIGILLGYDVTFNKREISKIHVAANWILAFFFLILCGWITSHIQPISPVYNVIWESTYVSVGRLLWSIAIAWIIYACTQGYGGLVTKFLSLPIFIPLSRLSYSIYLVHFILQVTTIGTRRTASYVTAFSEMYLVWGDLALSILIASTLYLFIEYPIVTLEKILGFDSSSTRVELDPPKRKTDVSSKLKEYLNLNENLFNSDFTIETMMVRLDFWQTVSDQINILTNGSPITAVEWLKIWQEWRLSRIENLSETELHAIRKIKIQGPGEMAAIEEELMLLVAAVNCGSIDSQSFTEPDAAKLKSQ